MLHAARHKNFIYIFTCVHWGTAVHTLRSQEVLPLAELSSFQNPSANWRIAGDAWRDLKENGLLRLADGKGVLVNLPDKNNKAADLYTAFQQKTPGKLLPGSGL